MTLQEITGSDVYGQVHWTTSSDFGRTWRDPEPIPRLPAVQLTAIWKKESAMSSLSGIHAAARCWQWATMSITAPEN